jgi:hypothetical protein
MLNHHGGQWSLTMEAGPVWRLKMELGPGRVCRPMVTDSHRIPDPHPDLHQNEEFDPDPN